MVYSSFPLHKGQPMTAHPSHLFTGVEVHPAPFRRQALAAIAWIGTAAAIGLMAGVAVAGFLAS